ncbi:PAS domain S-box protein [Brevundimonas sp.]|uniref:PAS domain S-box protein n=1 Tax=Brevundimonas sp. TaxID=1871086 RepID=UPI002737C85F|nr:PAS domain S-box protein [Brevundimonas sp.]MDP3801444.1 PAS domain S-box protein [Brevundimonas sp.]
MDALGDFGRFSSIGTAVTRLARVRTRPWWASALIGAGAAGVALLVRAALDGFYGDLTGFMILLPAVIVASLAAGRLAGLVATVVCLFGGWAVVGLDARGAGLADRIGVVATVNFVVVGLFVTVVGAALRDMVGALDASLDALRRSKARIDDSEHQLRLISEHAPVMLWMSDPTGRCVHLNAAQRAFWAVPESLEGFEFASLIHPDDAERVLAATIDAGNRQVPFETEARFLRHDGQWRILHTDAHPRIEPDGRYGGMIGVNIDVTEARAAEAALRESETRFRLMADTAPSPVWMTNAEAQVEFVNAALVDFYGQPADRILGDVWKLAIHPEDVASVEAAMEAARPDRLPYGFEARFQRADGAWRWMRISVKPRFDGEGTFLGYVGMSFDVTETREALDALERQERRQTFLLSLTDRVRDLATPEEVMLEAERALGSELGADRVGYGEVDQERGMVSMSRDWTAGVVSAQGEFRLEDFGGELIPDLSEGRLIRISDVEQDPRTRDALDVFQKLGTRALMRAPVIRGGRLRAFLYAHHSGVREWSEAEAELLQEVATRTWTEIERTRAEGEVRESEERFRAIADTAPVLIWVTQQDRTRAFVNQAYVAFNGGTYEEARLADWRAVIHPDDHERIISESLAGEATGQPFSMEARYLRHDGEYRWLKSFSRPRLGADGEVIGFVGVAFDVTDIREAQARLLESETRFRTVADSAPALIWMLDAEGRPIFANRRYRTFFGIDSETQLEEGWNRLIHPEDAPGFTKALETAFERQDRFESLVRVRHPAMGERWLRCEGLARFDGSGIFQGYVGANIDVTEAKRAEEDLKRINELLEERVGEALAEKAKAEADLMHAQRMEAVGRLTGGVAHDFNNLLTVVIGALDIMLRSPDDAAKRQRLGEAALAAARRGEGLTHQLLAFSRRQTLRPQAMDLNTQIRESEPLLRRAVGEAVEFKLKLRRGGARVSVDPSQFEAALLNLVVNARDALGDKGRIVVQTMSCAVQAGDVPDLPPGTYVCVTVSDNGSGMPPEVIGRVFEPFFTTKGVGKGTGLGLSQVYGFARQSGGAAHISSTVGRGTEIRLYLPPLSGEADATVPATPGSARPMSAGRRLLLVEDDVGVAAVALELLEGLGLEVRAVETGPQAREMLKRERFDIMLSDVVMPGGMTGIELARLCERDHPRMQVVLTSGYAGDDVDAALADAPWPFLRKPYSGEQLAKVLGDLVAPEGAAKGAG